MEKYYGDILIDHRTSCTRDEAAAIVLGIRTFDPIYPDLNSGADPDAVNGEFIEWLTTPLIEDLKNDRDIRVRELEDASGDQPEGTTAENEKLIEGLQARILAIDEAIRQAKQILCDIDDELARGSKSMLRIDKDETAKCKTTCITLNSLKDWSNAKRKQEVEIAGSFLKAAQLAKPALPSEPLLDKVEGASTGIEGRDDSADDGYDPAEDQCNDKDQMSKRGRDSLYLMLGILINLYAELAKEAIALVDSQPKTMTATGINNDYKAPYPRANAARKFVGKDGDLIIRQLAKHLETSAKPYGVRDAIRGQKHEMQLTRIEEALAKRTEKLGAPKPSETAAPIT